MRRRLPWALIPAWLAVATLTACGVPGPHAFVADPLSEDWRVAVLPLANYTAERDAPDRVAPILAVELARHRELEVVDAGLVEDQLNQDPWIQTDRVPPDLVKRLGEELKADALLVGSILGLGYREEAGEKIPQVSLSLRLLRIPEGKVLWSASHSRDGADGETIFGLGRVHTVEQLLEDTVEQMMDTLPPTLTGAEVARRRLNAMEEREP